MINLFKIKDKNGASRSNDNKRGAAHIRVQKDLSDLSLPTGAHLDFPSTDDLLNFTLIYVPQDGLYKDGKFTFSFKINHNYPHDPPKVKCENIIYHPNIDLEGNVCLNILREDWKPIMTITHIVLGISYIFTEPNADDPLNKEAADVFRTNKKAFEQNVKRAMQGQVIGKTQYHRVYKI